MKYELPKYKIASLYIRTNRLKPYTPGMHGETHTVEFRNGAIIMKRIASGTQRTLTLDKRIDKFFSLFDIIFFQFNHEPVHVNNATDVYKLLRGLRRTKAKTCFITYETDLRKIYDSIYYNMIFGFVDSIQTTLNLQAFTNGLIYKHTYNLQPYYQYMIKSFNAHKRLSVVDFGHFTEKHGHHIIRKCIFHVLNHMPYTHYNMKPNEYVKYTHCRAIEFYSKKYKHKVTFRRTDDILKKVILHKFAFALCNKNFHPKLPPYDFVIKSLLCLPIIHRSMVKHPLLPLAITKQYIKYYETSAGNSGREFIETLALFKKNKAEYIKRRKIIVNFFYDTYGVRHNEFLDNLMCEKKSTAYYKKYNGKFVEEKRNMLFSDNGIDFETFENLINN